MKISEYAPGKKFAAVAVAYFLLSAILLYKYGIQLTGEAEKYIDNAHRILNAEELRNGIFGVFYFTYSIIVAFFIRLSIPLEGVAVFQVVLSFVAAVYLYKLLTESTGNRNLAFIFFVAYLLCYPIQKWNFFLYSESFHVSLLVIGTYLFSKVLTGAGKMNAWKLLLLIILILFSRPVGIVFIIAIIITGLAWAGINKKKGLFFALLALCIAGSIGIFYSPITTFINPDSIRRMEVICQVSEKGDGLPYEEFNRDGLGEVFRVIREEIGYGKFLQNGGKKLGAFFGMYRSYYSSQNNLLLVLYWIFYPFALIGIFSKQDRPFNYIKWLATIYLLLTCIALIFTCDDWANRFIAPTFPFILLLAAAGLLTVFRKMNKGYATHPVG